MIKVAISSMFLDAYSKLPSKMQKKAREQIEKFKTSPKAGGLHHEKLVHSNDPNYHSFRLNDDYRAIVYEPAGQELYILVYVANHETSYKWANSHNMSINPVTGSLQVLDVESIQNTIDKIPENKKAEKQGLFKDVKDKHLLRMGVPEILMPAVRAIDAEWELDSLQSHLPQECADALFMLAAGYSVDEVIADIESRSPEEVEVPVDTNNFEKALENQSSQLRFCLVEDENAMAEILNAPLEKWRVFLHPSQNRLVSLKANGPVRVLGGAGTGKTVVAMHRAKWLAEHYAIGGKKVLFTTFTVNLAADIQDNLKKICSTETLKKIEVRSIDKWVSDFLKSRDYKNKIVFGKLIDDLWEDAYSKCMCGHHIDYVKDEWDLVVQNHGIETEKDYLRTKRPGRGKRLNRKQRKELWQVFEEFVTLKREKGIRELQDATRDAKVLLSSEGNFQNYCSIVVDEAQDMKPEVYRLFRQLIPLDEDERGKPNDLFIVGDGHQKIYKNHIKLSDYNINIRGRNRSFKLKINYRTTEEIRKWAIAYIKNREISDLDGELDNNKGYRSTFNGKEPEQVICKTPEEQIKAILKYIENLKKYESFSLHNVCLVTQTNADIEFYKKEIEQQGISCYKIKRSQSEDRTQKGLRIATMHRVKGLEFDHVIICGLSDKVFANEVNGLDELDRVENETRHRSLIYVAATRAKQSLFVTKF